MDRSWDASTLWEVLVVVEEVLWNEAGLEACCRKARAAARQEGRDDAEGFLFGCGWALYRKGAHRCLYRDIHIILGVADGS